MAILLNEAKCTKCGDVITSKHRHDYVGCKCGSIAVDGGMSYLRRIGDINNYEDRSIIVSESDMKKLLEVAEWCKETGRNSLGYVSNIVRVMQDLGLYKPPQNTDDEDDIDYVAEKRMDHLDLQLMNGVISQDEYDDHVKNIDGWAIEVLKMKRLER